MPNLALEPTTDCAFTRRTHKVLYLLLAQRLTLANIKTPQRRNITLWQNSRFDSNWRSWNSMWLLFVAKNGSDIQELSAPAITTIFNKHFRQSGAIKQANVSRDLGKYKSKTPPWVGEDAGKDPRTWYLTDEGEKIARGLVAA